MLLFLVINRREESMNKKLVALGAALLASTAAVQARVTGFYVGIQGGIDLAQFKIYDGTSHTGATMSHKVDPGSKYSGVDADGTTVTAAVPSIIKASDDFEATPEYVYKVRPAGQIFIGYNYQIGSNFVIGAEILGGLTFGAHKLASAVLVPNLTCYTRLEDKKSLIESSNSRDQEYFKGKYSSTQFELDTKFSGDLSLRLGCVIPGTDGRLAIFLRGGVGFVRQELTFAQKSGDLYYETIMNAALKAAKACGASQTTPGGKVSASYLQETFYVAWPFLGDCADYTSDATETATYKTAEAERNAAIGDNADARSAVLGPLVEHLVVNASTAEYGLVDQAKGKIKISDVNETKNRFTWHAGIDGEYHFANGLFVRASYTFKYVKGFFAEKSQEVKSLTKDEVKTVVKEAVTSGVFDRFLKEQWRNGTDRKLIYDDEGTLNKIKGVLAAGIGSGYESCPDQVSLGTLNTKVGTHEKSFSHHFTVGVGFKFCM